MTPLPAAGLHNFRRLRAVALSFGTVAFLLLASLFNLPPARAVSPPEAHLLLHLDPAPRRMYLRLTVIGPIPKDVDTLVFHDDLARVLAKSFGSQIEVDDTNPFSPEAPSGIDPRVPPVPSGWEVEAGNNPGDYPILRRDGCLIVGSFDLAPLLAYLQRAHVSNLQVQLEEHVKGAPVATCRGGMFSRWETPTPFRYERAELVRFRGTFSTNQGLVPARLSVRMGYAPADLLRAIAVYAAWLIVPLALLLRTGTRARRAGAKVRTAFGPTSGNPDPLEEERRLESLWFAYTRRITSGFILSILLWMVVFLVVRPGAAFTWIGNLHDAEGSVATGFALFGCLPALGLTLALLLSRPVNKALRGLDVSVSEVLLDSIGAVAGRTIPTIFGVIALSAVMDSLPQVLAVFHHEPFGRAVTILGTNRHLARAVAWYSFSVVSRIAFFSVLTAFRGPSLVPLANGEIYDRVVELAGAAGVPVQSILFKKTGIFRVANAFAAMGGTIILSDRLVSELTRSEIDAVIAHELGHLRHGHVRKQTVALLISVLAVMALMVLLLIYRAIHTDPSSGSYRLLRSLIISIFFPGMVVAAFWNHRAISRRHERVADLFAVALTGGAAPMVTALARLHRLNGLPRDWPRGLELFLTHPSAQRRFNCLASAGGLTPAEVATLVGQSDSHNPAPDLRYPLPDVALVDGRILSDVARTRCHLWIYWLWMTSVAAVGLAFGTLAGVVGARGTPAAVLADLAGVAAAFAVSALLLNYLSVSQLVRAEPALRRKRLDDGYRVGTDTYVGLSPGEKPLSYGGDLDWDAGFLSLEADHLRYRGERADLLLPKTFVTAIRSAAPWTRGGSSRIVIEWRASSGELGHVNLRPGSSRSLRRLKGDTSALLDLLRVWQAVTSNGDAVEEEQASPLLLKAAGRTAREISGPWQIWSVLVLASGIAVALGTMTGRSVPAIAYAALVTALVQGYQYARLRR